MELIVGEDYRSLACSLALTLTNFSDKFSSPPVKLTFISNQASNEIQNTNRKLPLLITEDGSVLTEPAVIMLYLSRGFNSHFTPKIQSQIYQWLAYATLQNFFLHDTKSLTFLNHHLESTTFFAAPHITVADMAAFSLVLRFMENPPPDVVEKYPNVIRWFLHIKNFPTISDIFGRFNFKTIESIPKGNISPKIMHSQSASCPSKSDEKLLKNKKDLKPKKKVVESSKADESVSGRPIDDVTRLEIRVGVIKKIWKHTDAEKLYCEEIDIGDEIRQIASGLRNHFSEEQLLNEKVLVLANMKPKNLRGFASHGMILCVSDSHSQKIELLKPPPNSTVGEKIFWEDLSGEPDPVMNRKEKNNPFLAVQPFLKTDDKHPIAVFKGRKFMTSCGPCFCESITGGTIS